MGGRGASLKRKTQGGALQRMLAVSKQWVEAKEKALRGNYAELHYELPDGKIKKAYWGGANFVDWKSDMALARSKRKGVLKVKFRG